MTFVLPASGKNSISADSHLAFARGNEQVGFVLIVGFFLNFYVGFISDFDRKVTK